jgi:nitrogen fixation/metabolism regulation signal transduction histidine kinase
LHAQLWLLSGGKADNSCAAPEAALNLESIRLRTAVVVGSLLLAVFGIGASVGLVVISSYLHDAAQGIKTAVDSIAASEELQVNLLDHNREHLLFDHTGDQVHANRRDAAAIRLERGADTIAQHVNTDAERALVEEVRDLIRQYVAERREAGRSEDQGAIQAYVSGASTLDEVAHRLRELISINQGQAQALYESIDRQDRIADILGIGIAATLLGIVFVLVFGVRSVIYRPLLDLREAVKKFGDGDFKARAAPHGPQDIREIADVFNDMAEKLERGRGDQLRFLAAVAHDLRNPLNAIRMSMDLVASSPPDNYDEIREMAEIVRRQSEHLDRMAGDLLDRSRVEAGLFDLRLEECDLRRLVNDVVRLQQATTSMHRNCPEYTGRLCLTAGVDSAGARSSIPARIAA